jgi:hypothetical protein
LLLQAFGMLSRYNLHMQGITYQAQGFALDELGTLPARLIDEHQLVARFVHEANEDARKEALRKK